MSHSWSLTGGLFEGGLSLVVVVCCGVEETPLYVRRVDRREMINHFISYTIYL